MRPVPSLQSPSSHHASGIPTAPERRLRTKPLALRLPLPG